MANTLPQDIQFLTPLALYVDIGTPWVYGKGKAIGANVHMVAYKMPGNPSEITRTIALATVSWTRGIDGTLRSIEVDQTIIDETTLQLTPIGSSEVYNITDASVNPTAMVSPAPANYADVPNQGIVGELDIPGKFLTITDNIGNQIDGILPDNYEVRGIYLGAPVWFSYNAGLDQAENIRNPSTLPGKQPVS